LALPTLNNDRQDDLPVVFKEAAYSADEGAIDPLQFGLDFFVRFPPLRQDCGEAASLRGTRQNRDMAIALSISSTTAGFAIYKIRNHLRLILYFIH
jgi:hypothetical protein